MTIDSNFMVGGVKFGTEDLQFIYQNMSQIPNGTNFPAGTVYNGVYDTSKTYNPYNYEFSMSGTAYLTIGGIINDVSV